MALALLAAAGAGCWLGKDEGLAESEAHARGEPVAATWATTLDG